MTDNEMLKLILEKMGNLEGKIGNLEGKIGNLEGKMENLEGKVGNLESDMQEVKHKITKIDLNLENEIRVNIQRIAEGHLDLSRNLHDAMHPSSEFEMLAVKVRMLEAEVRELKYRIS